ncbi:MAG: ABC transporter ATP-binding protein [Oscillospiraceae bacterium]|nr:ABC transporter ATP-binding protein [Oscillospiraceae bacterium]
MEHPVDLNRKIMMSCRNDSKTFYTKDKKEIKSLDVVQDFNFDVYENEFVVLFGPAECGKTTIMNILAGLDSASSGEVRQNDELVTGPDPKRGFVYQSISLFPWLTVMGNVEFGPKARGVSKAERREKSQYLIDLVRLSGFEKAFPNQLSGGMRQRVGIARAYCNEPELLFMDEPFGALDAQTRYMMEEEISRIHTAEKRTVVFVTNNIEEAIYLADRIVLLKNKPTSIKKEYIIDIPRPRDYTSPEFLALREEITSMLDEVIETKEVK